MTKRIGRKASKIISDDKCLQNHLVEIENNMSLLATYHTLSSSEKSKVCKFFKKVKFLDSYFPNKSRCMNLKEKKFSSLKSHECYVFM